MDCPNKYNGHNIHGGRNVDIRVKDIIIHQDFINRSQIDIEWAIRLNRCILRIVGLWPQDSNNSRETLLPKLRLLFNVITLIFVLTIPAVMSLIRVWGDMILMIDNLQYTLPLLITVLKVSIMWCKKKALSSLIDMIVRDWMRVKVKEERKIMLKRARNTRVLALCGGVMILFTLLITIPAFFGLTVRHVTNLTNPGKPLLIQAYYLHDVSKSPQFELTFLVQAIALTLSGLSYTGIDNFLGLLILHICGQMENLHLRLLNLGNNPNFKAALKFNVKDHIRLIRSIEVVDNTFDLMLLGLLFLFGILFCLHGFLIINVVNQGGHLSFMQLTSYILASVCVLMHMCLYCAVGEFLVTQSEKIHCATYEYIWYNLEAKAARNMLIMLRAKKPLHITAGKIFPMTMITFCNLLKTSAGYVSVLLANRD
ncbi:odorant receptor Or2-like [Formica exsecta]|uniref:odorant receptor Or2-like n=1 Tax=Formica exsecta TaxID=72781 RepID=UPI0011427CE5|nr:odorant receptor Or2-like [Formica exsecta]